ncbi:MAG: hypothetical protein K0R55_3002 [Sporomusa sp.]|jgi:hypothetical protein|nr:hypothetical protein [Sporomusa sp.]
MQCRCVYKGHLTKRENIVRLDMRCMEKPDPLQGNPVFVIASEVQRYPLEFNRSSIRNPIIRFGFFREVFFVCGGKRIVSVNNYEKYPNGVNRSARFSI